MSRIARLVSIGLILFATAASADWFENGTPASESSWRRADGDFGAMLLVTHDVDAFLAQWNRPAAPGYQPNIHTTENAERGDTVSAVVLFFGCEPGPARTCKSVVDFRVVRPDGSIYVDHESAPLWDGEPPPGGNLQLGAARLVFEVEPDDPIGTYRIKARARDLVSLREVILTQELTVGPAARPAPHTSPASP